MGGTFASAENGVAFEAWQGAGGVGFRELPNGFFSVYSDSGANKTGGLNFIRSEFEKAEDVFSASSVVTGFTVEGLRAAMADNRGNATIMVDEAKNFYAAMTQYASRGSDSAEKFLELLNGVSQKTVRVGGTGEPTKGGDDEDDGDDSEEDAPPSRHSKKIELSRPHLVALSGTHPHCGVENFSDSACKTDGRNARQLVTFVRAIPVRLPKDRRKLETLATELYGMPQLWELFCIMKLYTRMLIAESGKDGKVAMTLTEDAWAAFHVYYDSCDDDLEALANLLESSQQVSIISKSKGLALKLSGGKMLLIIALRVYEEHADELKEWREGKSELETLISIVGETIHSIIAEGDAAGGQITLEAVKMGIADAVFNRQTSLAIFNNTTLVDPSLLESLGASPSSSSSPPSGRESVPPKETTASPSQRIKVPPPKNFPVGKHPQQVLQACGILLAALKAKQGMVNASLVAEGMADTPKLLIGREADPAWSPSVAPKKPSFCQAGKVLIEEGIAEAIVFERPAAGGPARVFLKLKNLLALIHASEDPINLKKAFEVKLAQFLIPNVAVYDACYRRVIDFTPFDDDKAVKYMLAADIPGFKAESEKRRAAAATAAQTAGVNDGDILLQAPAGVDEVAANRTAVAAAHGADTPQPLPPSRLLRHHGHALAAAPPPPHPPPPPPPRGHPQPPWPSPHQASAPPPPPTTPLPRRRQARTRRRRQASLQRALASPAPASASSRPWPTTTSSSPPATTRRRPRRRASPPSARAPTRELSELCAET